MIEIMQLCKKLRVSMEQLVFMMCIHRKEYGLIRDYISDNLVSQELFTELIGRGHLKYIGKEGTLDLSKLRVSDIISKHFGVPDNSDELFDEFVAGFPRFIYINGKRVAALNADMDELQKAYIEKVVVKGRHNEVMEALHWARENHQIHMGIKLWFSSRQWKSIQEIMNDDSGSRLPSNNLL